MNLKSFQSFPVVDSLQGVLHINIINYHFWCLKKPTEPKVKSSPSSPGLIQAPSAFQRFLFGTPRNSKVKTKAKAKEHKMKFTAAAAWVKMTPFFLGEKNEKGKKPWAGWSLSSFYGDDWDNGI